MAGFCGRLGMGTAQKTKNFAQRQAEKDTLDYGASTAGRGRCGLKN